MSLIIGERMAAITSPPLDRLRIAYMAVAMRDPNLVHIEDEYARDSGLPGVIGHGTFTVAYMCNVVTRAVGVDALKDFDFSITVPILVGDTVLVEAEVTAVEPEPAGGSLVTVAVTATTQNGAVAGRGRASFLSED